MPFNSTFSRFFAMFRKKVSNHHYFFLLSCPQFLRSHKRLIHNRRILHTQKEHTQLFTTLSWSQFSFHIFVNKTRGGGEHFSTTAKKSFYRNFLIFISFLSTIVTHVCVWIIARYLQKLFMRFWMSSEVEEDGEVVMS